VITDVVQRWREHRETYRPAREVVDVLRLEVAVLERAQARAFVEAHHYERSMPADRFRFGLFDRTELVGVAVFSQPVRDEVTACLPGEPIERTELGRLVLLDRVAANAESFFVARCADLLRRDGLTGFVSLHGARAPRLGEDLSAWLLEVLPSIARTFRHPGKHRYAWTLHRRDRRHLPASLPYPKFTARERAVAEAA
jgi:hypothetical protein